MKKVDDSEQEILALRQAGEQKDKEIKHLQSELKAVKKSCDAEVSQGVTLAIAENISWLLFAVCCHPC